MAATFPGKELLVEFEVPMYVRQFTASKSMKAKYYEEGSKRKVPEKYKDPDRYGYVDHKVIRNRTATKVKFLTDLSTFERVVANPHLIGKPRVKNINGQAIYNGEIARQTRNSMIKSIKVQLKQHIDRIEVLRHYPLRIDVYLMDTVIDEEFGGSQRWDVDNRMFPYCKAISDQLKESGKIKDDCRLHITEPPHGIFVPVDDVQDRKLVIRIYKDTRKVITENFHYKQEHKL